MAIYSSVLALERRDGVCVCLKKSKIKCHAGLWSTHSDSNAIILTNPHIPNMEWEKPTVCARAMQRQELHSGPRVVAVLLIC
jgi:hypothetical protein